MNHTLSRDAGELVREGRRALRPTDADKARVLAAIQSRLVGGQLIPQADAPAPPAEASGAGLTVSKLAALTAGTLAAVTAFVLFVRGQTEAQPLEPALAATSSVAMPSATPSTPVPELHALSTQPAQVVTPRTPPVGSTNRVADSDRLAEEVALLTRAEKEFHAGNFKLALAATDEHRQKFPKGVLAPERVNLRVQLLCSMGRNDDAHSEATRLERLSPGHVKLADACPRGP